MVFLIAEYHPRFVGLTGTVEDIRQVAREYRVYYMKTEDEGSDYLVDHSIITYNNNSILCILENLQYLSQTYFLYCMISSQTYPHVFWNP